MAATESCPRAKCHESHPSSVAELVQHLWLPYNCYGEVMGLCLFSSSFLLVKREGRRVREWGKKKVASSIRKLVRFVFSVYERSWSSQVMQGNYRWWKLRSQPQQHCKTYCFNAMLWSHWVPEHFAFFFFVEDRCSPDQYSYAISGEPKPLLHTQKYPILFLQVVLWKALWYQTHRAICKQMETFSYLYFNFCEHPGNNGGKNMYFRKEDFPAYLCFCHL